MSTDHKNTTKERYDFLVSFLIAKGILGQQPNGGWIFKDMNGVDDSAKEIDTIESVIDKVMAKRKEIITKYLGTDEEYEEARKESNRAMALYVDSLLSGSQG